MDATTDSGQSGHANNETLGGDGGSLEDGRKRQKTEHETVQEELQEGAVHHEAHEAVHGGDASDDGENAAPSTDPPAHSMEESEVEREESSSSASSSSSPVTSALTTGEHDDGSNESTILEPIEAKLARSDFIMDVDVFDTLEKYIKAGGKPQRVIENLSDGYVGYAQMSNLVGGWLSDVSHYVDPSSNVGTAGNGEGAVSGGGDGSDGSEDTRTPSSANGSSGGLATLVVEEYIKELLERSFDPRVADSTFGGSQGVPAWLTHMIESPEWRPVLYRLSEKHRDCLMLNYAIQKISEAGHQGEIGSLVIASTYFGVFNRVLRNALRRATLCDDTELTSSVIPELLKMCTHSQHTYLYTLAVCRELATVSERGHILMRIEQELEGSLFRLEDRSSCALRLHYLISSLHSYPRLSKAVTSLFSSGELSTGDVIALYDEYTKAVPPPIDHLRHPVLISMFVKHLFDPSKTTQRAHLPKYLYVLSYATSAVDERVWKSDDGAAPTCTGKVDKSRIPSTRSALQAVYRILNKNPSRTELQQHADELESSCKVPVVAAGVLHWIGLVWSDQTFYATAYDKISLGIHLRLLRKICDLHPLDVSSVLSLLVTTFDMDIDLHALTAMEHRQKLLDCMVYLLAHGHVTAVIDAVRRWAPTIDLSLSRHILMQIMSVVQPPFSGSFTSKMLQLLVDPVITDTLKQCKDMKNVLAFLENCRDAADTTRALQQVDTLVRTFSPKRR
eukprot:TRINITY_DN3629_c0_g1_i1.p1 TRINITY_DN3629_c0_g1~~TRINITY_DN3629_c0_g1_i1.p1  ORF type:complete len:733 (+),score=159.04 TRINITY_DN3629_c0_g1_i1:142-2340(+)